MASEKVSELKRRSRMKRRKKKKSDANVNRKFGIMKWSQSPGKKKMGSKYFVMEGGQSCFSPPTPGQMDFKRQ